MELDKSPIKLSDSNPEISFVIKTWYSSLSTNNVKKHDIINKVIFFIFLSLKSRYLNKSKASALSGCKKY